MEIWYFEKETFSRTQSILTFLSDDCDMCVLLDLPALYWRGTWECQMIHNVHAVTYECAPMSVELDHAKLYTRAFGCIFVFIAGASRVWANDDDFLPKIIFHIPVEKTRTAARTWTVGFYRRNFDCAEQKTAQTHTHTQTCPQTHIRARTHNFRNNGNENKNTIYTKLYTALSLRFHSSSEQNGWILIYSHW